MTEKKNKVRWGNPKTGQEIELHIETIPKTDFIPEISQVGIELEMFMVRNGSKLQKLGKEGLKILQSIQEKFPERIGQELPMDMIEIRTKPHQNAEELQKELEKIIQDIKTQLETQNIGLIAIGNDPFEPINAINWENEFISGIIKQKHGKPSASLSICASLQATVQVGCGNAAIFLNNTLRSIVPIFVALTANAPFWNKELWEGMTSRPYFRAILMDSGWVAPYIQEKNFLEYWEKQVQICQLKKVAQAPWAHNGPIRIRPDREKICIEWTPMDSVPVKYVGMLTDFFVQICNRLLELYVQDLPCPEFFGLNDQIAIQKNMMEACIRGKNGNIITQNLQCIQIQQAIEQMAEFAYQNQTIPQDLQKFVEQPTLAEQLIQTFQQTQNFDETLKTMIE